MDDGGIISAYGSATMLFIRSRAIVIVKVESCFPLLARLVPYFSQ